MQKITKIILWVSIAVICLLVVFISLPIFFNASWWWFFIPLIIIVVAIILTLVIFMIKRSRMKKKFEEQKPKDQIIDPEQARAYLLEVVAKRQDAEYIEKPEEKITHEGGAGRVKTPVFHLFGDGYYTNRIHYYLLNMNNPKIVTKLVQADDENKEKFLERVSLAISKFASEPEIFETEEKEIETPSGDKIKTTKKRQTVAEIKEKEKEKEVEEKEEI